MSEKKIPESLSEMRGILKETDKEIAERVLSIKVIYGHDTAIELAKRLLAADALLNKPVGEITRYAITMDGCMDPDPTGDFVRIGDHLSAMRSRAEGVPEGYVLIREEPMTEMLDAMYDHLPCTPQGRTSTCVRAIYAAIIDVATLTPPGGTKYEG